MIVVEERRGERRGRTPAVDLNGGYSGRRREKKNRIRLGGDRESSVEDPRIERTVLWSVRC